MQDAKQDRTLHLSEGHARAVRAMVRSLAGDVDTTGVELMRLVRMVANQYDMLMDDELRSVGLSGPRWHLLLRLLVEEGHGTGTGTSPTHLSRCQSVSKNTISALLRGLEEQGLIERALDPYDRRVFRIRLTDSGRELIQATAPENVLFLSDLVEGLSPTEQAQLVELLDKLYRSVQERTLHACTGAQAPRARESPPRRGTEGWDALHARTGAQAPRVTEQAESARVTEHTDSRGA